MAISALAFLIVYPLGRMLLRTFVVNGQLALAPAGSLFAEPWLPIVLANTAVVVLSSTVIAVLVGGVLAWINERTDAHLGLLRRSRACDPGDRAFTCRFLRRRNHAGPASP